MINLFETVLRLSIAGGLICIVIFGLFTLLRNRLPKAWLYCLWLAAVLRFVIPVSFSLPFNAPQINIVPALVASEPAASHAPVAADNLPYDLSPMQDAAPQATYENQEALIKFKPAAPAIDTAGLLTAVWLTGAGVMLLWYTAGYGLTMRKLKRNRIFLKMDKVPVYACGLISTPILTGLLRPAIYLPKDFSGADLAIKHELCHLRRGDLWSKWLIQLVVCIHWFNPLIYLLKRETNRLSELACDEAVVRHLDTAERRAYGHMLLATLRTASGFGGPMIAALGSHKHWLKERMHGIMLNKKTTRKTTAAMSILTAVILSATVVFGAILTGCANSPGTSKEDDITAAVTDTASAASPDQTASASAPSSPDGSAAVPSGSVVVSAVYYVTTKIVDLPFDDDPAVIGTWLLIDKVDSVASFDPDNLLSSSETNAWELVINRDDAHGLYAYYTQHAGFQHAQGNPQWDSTGSYEIKELDGVTYLFVEEKINAKQSINFVFEKLSDTVPAHTVPSGGALSDAVVFTTSGDAG